MRRLFFVFKANEKEQKYTKSYILLQSYIINNVNFTVWNKNDFCRMETEVIQIWNLLTLYETLEWREGIKLCKMHKLFKNGAFGNFKVSPKNLPSKFSRIPSAKQLNCTKLALIDKRTRPMCVASNKLQNAKWLC